MLNIFFHIEFEDLFLTIKEENVIQNMEKISLTLKYQVVFIGLLKKTWPRGYRT